MAERYNPREIETKWQKRWAEDRLYKAAIDHSRPKFYFLTMLPYTSGDLHCGHWYAMAPSDAAARHKRMQGYNVMFPIGFDAFGLPAENAAIRQNIHPKTWTYDNIDRMRRQLRSMGAMWDWDREAISSDPEYYKWTEWFFLQFYKAGLAYKEHAPVDFCPQCNTTLAREQVWGEDRHCERCGTPVVKKDLDQWLFRITNYAEELLEGLEKIDWPERVKTMQRNWIGRSEGAEVVFKSEDGDDILVFTTRPDTLWGATFMVLAPEHPLVEKLTREAHRAEVEAYCQEAARKTEIERAAADKEKTGVFIGAYAVNPVNGERIPIWVADYVMMTYGTGSIMAVPAHDERDFQFALKFGLPIIPVIAPPGDVAKSFVMAGSMEDGFPQALTEAGIACEQEDGNLLVTLTGAQVDRYIELARAHIRPGYWTEVIGARWVFVFEDAVINFGSLAEEAEILKRCQALEPSVADARTVMEMLTGNEFYQDLLYHDTYGTMINSGPFSGTPGDVARQRVTDWLEEQGIGRFKVNYRLHDWLISRQRYWGAPIPIIYCGKCGIVPVPEEDLPVLLPDDVDFRPTGESPLKFHEEFRSTTCPQCGGQAERETDTMDTFMCSSWYQYRYLSPDYHAGPFDPQEGQYWLPVDQYTGGVEHATMHLIYTRFFTKVMRDLGLVDFDEPMLRLFNQGVILGEDGEKMSKSRRNVVDPDGLVERYGADTFRTYLMFIGPWELGGPWNSRGIDGVWRFYNRVWNLITGEREQRTEDRVERRDISALRRLTHQTIRKVSEDFVAFRFNTAIAALMALNNELMRVKETPLYGTPAWDEAVESLLLMLAPMAPHITEELWSRLGKPYSIHQQPWPAWDEEIAREETFTLVVQVNGKVRDRIQVPVDIGAEDAKTQALASEGAKRHTDGKKLVKMVYVPGRLVNIVVK